MMKKSKGPILWLSALIIAIIAALVAGYYFGKEKDIERVTVTPDELKKTPTLNSTGVEQAGTESVPGTPTPDDAAQIKKDILPEKEVIRVIVRDKTPPTIQKDPCEIIEEQLSDFFTYLDSKSYVRRMEKEPDTGARFRKLIKKMSSNPPVPAGEGLDKEIMIKNIFHFFRILDLKDIRLIKEVLNNEADSLEINLELFYKWLTQEEECTESAYQRPSPETSHIYAGYFLNTLGGKAYLSRRPTKTKLLISYYCVLILFEADKNGKNRYGIDIFPKVNSLIKDITVYPDLQFQGDYIERLNEIQAYYLRKR